ncbi:MAG: peptidoglycan editing factor PgeF [Alphaproteobacteria bacterium]|nr:peptidoglycan editing factor PgeF [Alphaproteobacteria bacterium]
MIQSPSLSALPGIRHRFFTREGGVSEGLFTSLNCGYGSADLPENVRENRRRAAAQFELDEPDLQTLHQIHSTDVRVAGVERWQSPGAPKSDALVTDRPGVVLGVLSADCAPVLFADRRGRAVGAAHAGWRGALEGVTDATIAALERLGVARADLVACVGPCIGRDTYEVGPEFPAPFVAQDPDHARFFKTAPRSGHFHFDLAGYLLQRLARAGVAASATGHDTLDESGRFFSYRRNTLRGIRDYGRGLSAIALEG